MIAYPSNIEVNGYTKRIDMSWMIDWLSKGK